MQEFEPRLLTPDAIGIPAHMAVAHDARVYGELADPQKTAVIYAPKWSQPVREAFARLAELPFDDNYRHIKGDQLMPQLHAVYQIEDSKSFMADNTLAWLLPALKPHAGDENRAVIDEIAERQSEFAAAALNLMRQGGKTPWVRFEATTYKPNTSILRHMPHNPKGSEAHTDPTDTGLFSFPIGTVLVDQTDLSITALRHPKGSTHHTINVAHLANRLWQIPDASFAVWRGGAHLKAQYHLLPEIKEPIIRGRLFAHP